MPSPCICRAVPEVLFQAAPGLKVAVVSAWAGEAGPARARARPVRAASAVESRVLIFNGGLSFVLVGPARWAVRQSVTAVPPKVTTRWPLEAKDQPRAPL